MAYELKLFSGNANRPLAEEIAQHLRIRLGDADVSRFSDGEVYVQINENVRGEDVFVIQPTCPPVNDTLMELLVMMDALKRASARRITAGLAIIDKRRDGPNVALFMYLIGDVKNKDVVVIDDMIDTAGTLIQAVEAVKREGARRVLACAVHGVLSGPALKRIEESPLEEVIITNSVPLTPGKVSPKVHVLSVAPLLAEAIRRIHDEESVSTLFV